MASLQVFNNHDGTVRIEGAANDGGVTATVDYTAPIYLLDMLLAAAVNEGALS